MKILGITSCGSTNEELKKRLLAMTEGSPLPPAIAALEQTNGRGRKGRSFSSPYGKGLYLSVPVEISSLTDALCVMPMTAVCVCRAVETLSSAKCEIKWPNDVLCKGRKLCGILTELVIRGGRKYLIIGVGVNLTQGLGDFPEELKTKAISILQASEDTVSPFDMANCLVPEIELMIKALPEGKAEYLEDYRKRCVTAGKDVDVFFSETSAPRRAQTLEITDDFRLLVRWEDGRTEALDSGEVSVR